MANCMLITATSNSPTSACNASTSTTALTNSTTINENTTNDRPDTISSISSINSLNKISDSKPSTASKTTLINTESEKNKLLTTKQIDFNGFKSNEEDKTKLEDLDEKSINLNKSNDEISEVNKVNKFNDSKFSKKSCDKSCVKSVCQKEDTGKNSFK